MWKHRAISDWLQDGDRNATFFKAKASQRRTRKLISTIKKADGTIAEGNQAIIVEFTNYFTTLFQASTHEETIDWNRATEMIKPRISEEANRKLTEPYTEEEVCNVIFQMHPTKAPGPD